MSLLSPDALAEQIVSLCNHYAEESRTARPAGKKFKRLFQHWISYDERQMDAEDEAFLAESDRLVYELGESLAGADADDANRIALRVAELLIFSPEDDYGRKQPYLKIAGYSCAVLFPYISKAELERIRERMLSETPRRMMFPKERELLDALEGLLKE